MKRNIYWLILTNAFRVYQHRINEKTERIFPEFKKGSAYFLYISLITQILLILVLLSVNFRGNPFVENTITDYGYEIILLKFMLEVIILKHISKFAFPKKIQMIYGILPSMFYIICSNFKHFYTWILIQLFYMKLFGTILFSSFFILSIGILFAFLYAKLVFFKYSEGIIKGVFLSVITLFIFSLSNKLLKKIDVHLHITDSQMLFLAVLASIAVLILACTPYLFGKVNTTNYILKKTHLRRYMKCICFSIIMLAGIMLLSQTFEIVGRIEHSLVLMSFLLVSLLVKTNFVNYMTVETYGYFLFYMKSVDCTLQKNIIRDVQFNNYILLLPILVIHSSYLLLQQNFIFLGILLFLYLLDIKTDELVIYITRKVVKKNELPNLFIHSKKGLSSVLLIAFVPAALITFVVKSKRSVSELMGTNMLLILILLIACVSLVAYIWKRSFFKDLFK